MFGLQRPAVFRPIPIMALHRACRQVHKSAMMLSKTGVDGSCGHHLPGEIPPCNAAQRRAVDLAVEMLADRAVGLRAARDPETLGALRQSSKPAGELACVVLQSMPFEGNLFQRELAAFAVN